MEIRVFWDFLDEYDTTTNNIHDVEVLERRYGYKMVPMPRVLDDHFLCDLRSDQIISLEMSHIPIRSYVKNVSQIRSMI